MGACAAARAAGRGLIIDFNLMRAFLGLYQTRSVSEAADRMGVSQPGMSAMLRRLRQLFDDDLFVRTSNGMIPTTRARQIEAPIAQVVEILAKNILASTSFSPDSTTRFFVTAMSDMSEYIFLPKLTAELHNEAPGARLVAHELDWKGCEAALENGELDLAIGLAPDMMSHNILETVVSNNTFGCFVARDHPLAGKEISLVQFVESLHVVCENEERGISVLDRHLAALGAERKAVVVTRRLLTMPEIVAKAKVMAVLPLKPGLPSPYANLAQVVPPFDFPVLDIKVYWHRLVNDDPAHSWFRRLVARTVRSIGSPEDGEAIEAAIARIMHDSGNFRPMITGDA